MYWIYNLNLKINDVIPDIPFGEKQDILSKSFYILHITEANSGIR